MKGQFFYFSCLLTALMFLMMQPSYADVKPHTLFSDGAVLQQGVNVNVWGTADNGEKVTVTFQGQKAQSTAKNGKWTIRLKPLKPGGPFTMVISGKNTVEVKNILVGEVWICSGQSNMQWSLHATEKGEEAVAASGDPMLRLFTVPRITSETPLTEVSGTWSECAPESARGFSAVGYFFGRDLRKALKVPVGVINTSWGGTFAEAWATRSAFEKSPEFKDLLANVPGDVNQPNRPTVLYNSMIAPLQPYAISGAIWYQGESNAGRAEKYRRLFPMMIKSWRDSWGVGDFTFLFVQLAPFQKIVTEPEESAWAELREAQLLTSLNTPNTGMAVITDCGDEVDIHPKRKEPVGARLALAARALTYKEQVVYCGPLYKSMTVRDNRAILYFDSIGSGLEAKGGQLTGFTVAGEDKKFYNANATIVGDRVVVSSPSVTKPVAVRYGWANCPVVNLFNKEGLPASPFRTDDFPMVTAVK